MKAIVPLAPGFEEIEAVTIIDVLRRADIETISAGVGSESVKGAHSITVKPDSLIEKLSPDDFSVIILPGGMPGSKNLMNSQVVINFINTLYNKGGYACAVCAAPIVLAKAGILKGKRVTCFPGYESLLQDANIIPDPVVIDERIITGKGPGCAIAFILAIIETLKGHESFTKLKDDMQIYWF